MGSRPSGGSSGFQAGGQADSANPFGYDLGQIAHLRRRAAHERLLAQRAGRDDRIGARGRQLVGLITRRSEVRVLLPLPKQTT